MKKPFVQSKHRAKSILPTRSRRASSTHIQLTFYLCAALRMCCCAIGVLALFCCSWFVCFLRPVLCVHSRSSARPMMTQHTHKTQSSAQRNSLGPLANNNSTHCTGTTTQHTTYQHNDTQHHRVVSRVVFFFVCALCVLWCTPAAVLIERPRGARLSSSLIIHCNISSASEQVSEWS